MVGCGTLSPLCSTLISLVSERMMFREVTSHIRFLDTTGCDFSFLMHGDTVSNGSEQYLVLHGEVCGSPRPRYTGFRGVNAGILRRRDGHHYWFSTRNFAGDCVH